MSTDSTFQQCPGDGCQYELAVEGPLPIFDCPGCGRKFCTSHRVPWHEGESCERYDRRINGADQGEEADQPYHGFTGFYMSDVDFELWLVQQAEEKRRRQEEEAERRRQEEEAERQRQEDETPRRREEEEAERRRQQEQLERRQAEAEAERERQREEDRQRREREIQESEQAVRSMTKECPHCHAPIEKNGGCDHMTCKSSQSIGLRLSCKLTISRLPMQT